MNIIVSRYNENVEWTKDFSNVIIYNKGEPLNNEYNEILLNNVGREQHTFYKYIYDNYDNLGNYTIFLQGNPFDHLVNTIEKLNEIINNKEYNKDFEILCHEIIPCNLSGCKWLFWLPKNEYLIDTYEKLFNERKENMEFIFGAGGQFIVSKKNILKHPKDFYLKIVESLQYDINPVEGHIIERFHQIIFDN
jgi:hypothetical protein